MKAWIDGSGNGYYGYRLSSGKQRLIRDWDLTNNQAEWLSFLLLLLDLEENTKVHVFSDSLIVVNQYYGDWKTKNKTLRYLKTLCSSLIEIKNLEIHLEWINREENIFGKALEKIRKEEAEKTRKLRLRILRGY